MGIVLGLLAAACYGAADFLGGLAARRAPLFAVTVGAQAVGVVLLAIALPFYRGTASAHVLVFGALAGFCGAGGIALLYRALAIGTMGIVSPITAVVAAALPVVIGLVRGEHLTALQEAGIALAMCAVALISWSPQARGRAVSAMAGVHYAFASGVLIGGFYVFIALTGKNGGLYPLLASRIAASALLLAAAVVLRKNLIPVKGTWPLIVVAGIIDTTANGLYLLTTYAGYLSIAAVLTSLYPASTVFLARFVLNERLGNVQKIGVATALAGVALIAS